MSFRGSTISVATTACAVALLAGVAHGMRTPQSPPAGANPGVGRGGRGAIGPMVFAAADINKDGSVTRDELKTTIDTWFAEADRGKTGSVTRAQLTTALDAALPPAPQAAAPQAAPASPPAQAARSARAAQQPPAAQSVRCGGRGDLPRVGTVPCPADVQAMMAALPDSAPAKPMKPRKVLVLGAASGFVHSSIPLAAKTIEEMGKKTGAWSTTITYDAADINTDNLKQYDAIFLSSTTGCFLDVPQDKAATDARRRALLAFIRGGKGLAGIHAAGDSYHSPCPNDPPAADSASAPGGAATPGAALASVMLRWSDKNVDSRLTKDEVADLPDLWFNTLDPTKTGKVSQQDFAMRFPAITSVGQPGRDSQVGSWPEYDKIIGGFFKFHWVDPQLITVKIDDPNSPLTQMFHGQEFEIHDETYTFGMDTWSRKNLHILTSIDYSKMSDADKRKEDFPRADHDYGLSWIRREGNGRVFYEAHGHNEKIYAIKPMLEHILAGMQYVLGDLKADDRPTQ